MHKEYHGLVLKPHPHDKTTSNLQDDTEERLLSVPQEYTGRNSRLYQPRTLENDKMVHVPLEIMEEAKKKLNLTEEKPPQKTISLQHQLEADDV
jgi:hypothetical protein